MTEHTDGRRRRYENRRAEIIEAATAHVLEHGITGLTLRKVALAAGISHPTLLHHVSTRDELIAEVVDAAVARALILPDLPAADADPLRTMWQRATSPQGEPYIRLFLELTGVSMYAQPAGSAAPAAAGAESADGAQGRTDEAKSASPEAAGTSVRAAVARSMRERVEALAAGMRHRGCPAEEATAVATSTLAAMRGLLADRLMTGDAERVDAAFEMLRADVVARASRWA